MMPHDDDDIQKLIKTHADYYIAPLDLLGYVNAFNKKQQEKHTWRQLPLWVASLCKLNFTQFAGGTLMGAVFAMLITTQVLTKQVNQDAMYLALLADHTQAIVTQRTIEIQSSNQHTVKPWLMSKLGYSPRVVDLSENGFPLLGGRRGFIGTTPLAVAVYAYQQHEIDVYVMTTNIYQLFPQKLKAQNGLNFDHWHSGDLQYIAVSDLNPQSLRKFSSELKNKQNNL